MSNYISVFGTLKDASFGGTNLSDKNYYCIDFVKGLMPNQIVNKFDVPKRAGKIVVDKKFDVEYITAKGFLEASSHSDAISKVKLLSAFLYSDEDKKFIRSDISTQYHLAQYLDYVKVAIKKDYALFDLIFECNDPFAYDTTADTDTQASVTTDDTTFIIANSGHYHAYPTFTITFNQAQEHIYLQNNGISGNRFDISKSFATDDVLIINGKTGVITLNGSNSPAGFGDGGDGSAEWVMLATGNNELQIGTDDISIDVDILTSFEKVYLS